MLKRFLLTILIVFIGSSLAQDDQKGLWVTGSVGYPFNFMVGVGAKEVFGDISLRAAVAATDDGAINLLLDALIDASDITLTPDFNVYGGLGALLKLTGDSQKDNSLHANLTLGIEHRLRELGLENMGLYMELGPSFQLTPSFETDFHGRAGINVHF